MRVYTTIETLGVVEKLTEFETQRHTMVSN